MRTITPGEFALWSYKARLTQSNVAGGNGIIVITVGTLSELWPQSITVIAGTLGAGRSVNVQFFDDDDVLIAYLARNYSLASTAKLTLPQIGVVAVAAEKAALVLPNSYCLSSGDKIYISMTAMADGETFDILVRGWLYAALPTVATTGSTGTVALSDAENKVMI